MAKTNERDLNFGKSLGELEQIIEWFEGDKVDLDEALRKFEKGMELALRLRAHLETVENKITLIKQKFASKAVAKSGNSHSNQAEERLL